MLSLGGSLFTYGHSLAENDSHILRLIVKSKVKQLFVSIYGDPESVANQEIVGRAEGLANLRPAQKPLAVQFYDDESANVWG